MRMRRLSVLVLLIFAASGLVFARVQARIAGVVMDTNGNPISEATVVITSDELADYHNEIKVDGKGKFKTLILDATRHYLFHVKAPGYQAQERPLKVQAGSTDGFFEFVLKSEKEAIAEGQAEILEQPGYKQLREATDLLNEGRTDEARAKYAEAVEAKPDLIPALTALAELNYEAGHHKDALATARKCLAVDDESIDCLAIAANAAAALGDTEAHSSFMAQYEELNPADPAILFNKAVVFLNKMDDEGARPHLEQCLEIDPEFPQCLFEYGMLLLRSGDMEGAKSNLEHFVEVAPDAPDAETARETIKYL